MRYAALAAGVALTAAGLCAGAGAGSRAVFGAKVDASAPTPSTVTTRRIGLISLRGGDPRWILVETRRPGMIRVEVDSPRGLYRAGFDGATAWQTYPGRGPRRATFLPRTLARRVAEIADIDGPAARWREEGYDLHSTVTGPAGEVLRIDAAGPEGWRGVLFVNAKTGNLIEWDGALDDGPRTRRFEVRFEAYVEIGGRQFPSCITAGLPGEAPAVVIEFSRFEIDPGIDDLWFSPPPVP